MLLGFLDAVFTTHVYKRGRKSYFITSFYFHSPRPSNTSYTSSQHGLGDQIVTYGGLIGEIVEIENENVFEVGFSKSDRIKVLRDSVERNFTS